MSNAKHSPGPWTVADVDELDTAERAQDPFGIYSADDGSRSGTKVANVLCSDPDITGDQIKGNALLIAAAPDLLVCTHGLKMLCDLLGESFFAACKDEPAIFKVLSHLREVKAGAVRALAKVEGRS